MKNLHKIDVFCLIFLLHLGHLVRNALIKELVRSAPVQVQHGFDFRYSG